MGGVPVQRQQSSEPHLSYMDQQTRRDNTTQPLSPEHPRRNVDIEDYRVGVSVYNRQPGGLLVDNLMAGRQAGRQAKVPALWLHRAALSMPPLLVESLGLDSRVLQRLPAHQLLLRGGRSPPFPSSAAPSHQC